MSIIERVDLYWMNLVFLDFLILWNYFLSISRCATNGVYNASFLESKFLVCEGFNEYFVGSFDAPVSLGGIYCILMID